jgi:RNA polymerase sigma-70 factor (ECF subfamily)
MIADQTDEELMQRYREGNLPAFTELYRRHSGGLFRFIAWRSPRREWVDEIVQDSWAALHEARARYEPTAGFRTFLYQIGRNRLIDLLRQKQLRLASELGAAHEDGEDRFAQLQDAAFEVASPETALQKKQEINALHQAIARLPVEQKEALVLQQFNAMSIEEIAAITSVTPETVKSRLRYAMQKLRSLLNSPGQPGESA